VFLAGCAASVIDVKATAPIRQKAGYVRLLNLSSDTVGLYDRGRQMVAPVTTNTASPFTTCPSGSHTISLKGESVDLKTSIDLKPGASELIVLSYSGKTSTTIEDARAPQNGHNLKLIYLNAEGSAVPAGPHVTLSHAGTRLLVSAKSPAQTLSEGTWNVAAEGLLKAEPIEITPDTVYDLVLIRSSSGRYSELVLPHLVIDKPKLAGTAKAG